MLGEEAESKCLTKVLATKGDGGGLCGEKNRNINLLFLLTGVSVVI